MFADLHQSIISVIGFGKWNTFMISGPVFILWLARVLTRKDVTYVKISLIASAMDRKLSCSLSKIPLWCFISNHLWKRYDVWQIHRCMSIVSASETLPYILTHSIFGLDLAQTHKDDGRSSHLPGTDDSHTNLNSWYCSSLLKINGMSHDIPAHVRSCTLATRPVPPSQQCQPIFNMAAICCDWVLIILPKNITLIHQRKMLRQICLAGDQKPLE